MTRMRFPLLLALLSAAGPAMADELNPGKKPADAGSPEAAMKSLAVAPGLQVEVWASEPLLENPVALAFDNQGRAYIAETNRRRSSALDIRKFEAWQIPNLSLKSVEDRVAFIKTQFSEAKKLKPSSAWADLNNDGQFDWRDLEVESEQIRVVEDSNADGKADQSRVLAKGFNTVATGVGAGLVSDGKGGVFYTCIPDLWHIAADGTKSRLHTGFGAHIVYSGHDMHGIRMGPDGRLYFSIADGGARVQTKEGALIDNPDSGAIFRCWPDGAELELFAKGLRNPQHLAFNDLGDLFTGDNNADGGDKARWIHVVKGGDYGWRIGWQFLPKLGFWNSEGQWHLNVAETNPAILPPVAHIGHGPAGICYYPGTGLPEKFRGHFFYADFPGGIRHFALKPKGATYELADFAADAAVLQNNQPAEMLAKLLWNLNPSDVQFAPGGGAMVLDWTPGWEKTGKGRIYRVFSPAADADPLTIETKKLLNEGFAGREIQELAGLLGHADQRVRLGAQFALVDRARTGESTSAITTLQKAAEDGGNLLARLHAIWGLGIAARSNAALLETVATLLIDAEPEVRAQAAHVLSEARTISEGTLASIQARVTKLLTDDAPRSRFFGIGLAGKVKAPVTGLIKTGYELRRDSLIRHAVAQALAPRWEEVPKYEGEFAPWAGGEFPALIQAMRLARRPECGNYLDDLPHVRLAFIRAIHDEPIPEAYPAVVRELRRAAEVVGPKPAPGAPANPADIKFYERVINVAYRVGDAEAAKALAAFAAAPDLSNISEASRLHALAALSSWGVNLGRDRLLGIVLEGDGKRDPAVAAQALSPLLSTLFAGSMAIRTAAAEAAGALKTKGAESTLMRAALDAQSEVKFRLAALRALGAIESPKFPEAIRAALTSPDKTLAAEARKLSSALGGIAAVEANAVVLGKGSITDQQEALATLAKLQIPEADQILADQLDLLLAGKLPPALHLDLLEAASTRHAESIKTRVAKHEAARKTSDPLARWAECMEGGDARLGRVIFAEKAEAGCMRCHAVKKEGGDVGPDLAGIGSKHDRVYLLRSVVEPNAEIAPGYENVLVTLANGEVIAGMANKEDAETLTLKSPVDGKPQTVKKSEIKNQQKLPSAMPPALGDVLGKRALRDLIAYLSTLQ